MTAPIILYDGVCHLCAGSVRFIIRNDSKARFRFASLQSRTGLRLAQEHGIEEPGLDSVILLHQGTAHRKSQAALRTCLMLKFPWPLMGILLLIPRVVADFVYDFIGRRRYRWFGRMEACWLPDAKLRQRFLDLSDPP